MLELVNIATTDLAGITRGRPVTARRLERIGAAGVGWVPANLCLTPFSTIPADNPWGSTGDLRLVPDGEARFRTAGTGSETALDLVMGNLAELDGAPWAGCTRTALKDALAALKEATGLSLTAAFEHEFLLRPRRPDPARPPQHAFSVGALRGADPFAPRLTQCLEEAGLEPEMVFAEYGTDQFEATVAPAGALQAADRAVALREITREVARNLGATACFAPKPLADAVGNGLHIHWSLTDAEGRPATYDPGGPGGLSQAAASFCAGVLKHLPALVALTASSPPSFFRLAPHNWSASYTWLGERDREATLRICPTVTIGGRDAARQFNVEYRAADATANPYLALAGIVRAGLAGIAAKLPAPPVVGGDPEAMSAAEREAKGLRRLPETLGAALEAFEADTALRGWLPKPLVDSFVSVKRAEIELTAARTREEVCALYAERY